MHHVFALFSINGWNHNLMKDHILSELKLRDFGFPTDKRSEVVIVDEEVEDSLGFGKMDQLGNLRSKDCLEVSVMVSFDGGANSPDE